MNGRRLRHPTDDAAIFVPTKASSWLIGAPCCYLQLTVEYWCKMQNSFWFRQPAVCRCEHRRIYLVPPPSFHFQI